MGGDASGCGGCDSGCVSNYLLAPPLFTRSRRSSREFPLLLCYFFDQGNIKSRNFQTFINIRAAVIPALESLLESDFGSFWTADESDSGSGSFSLESLESAPPLEPIPK